MYVAKFELTNVAQVLLLIRPGMITTRELHERFGNSFPNWIQKGLPESQRLGYVVRVPTGDPYENGYKLTEEGRKKCPTRRQVIAMDRLKHMQDVASDAELLEKS